ncbi:hypothetical protein NDU88_006876 [Pleurodeles waltl]|uniref:Uncharacterized protein n=1 Tax=Pleurodeles waltl TaxID=8319 RepID=A0AAV7N0I9_PLEWA|nr:hypothetical protein NDU88_006876 [Pleurodeles waltl]
MVDEFVTIDKKTVIGAVDDEDIHLSIYDIYYQYHLYSLDVHLDDNLPVDKSHTCIVNAENNYNLVNYNISDDTPVDDESPPPEVPVPAPAPKQTRRQSPIGSDNSPL